jgi:hypothetical protein
VNAVAVSHIRQQRIMLRRAFGMCSTAQESLSQGDDRHSAPLYDGRVTWLENGRFVLPVGVGLASKRLGPDGE